MASLNLCQSVSSRLTSAIVVDDDAAEGALLTALFRQALPEARIEVAENGLQALALIGKLKPDIVVTDIHMPHLDGFEMVRQMMAGEFMRPQTLIAVSASSAQELTALGQLPTDVLLLTKPLDQALVIATLRRAANGRWASRHAWAPVPGC